MSQEQAETEADQPDPGAAATYDIEALGQRSVAQEALDQLAMEHLLGVR